MFPHFDTMETACPVKRWRDIGWDEDVDLSDVEWKANESKDIQQIDYNELDLDEPKSPHEEPQESGVSHFLKANFRLKDCNGGINFAYIHDQDMNYYQEPTSYYTGNYGRDSEVRDFNHTSMLGNIPEPSRSEQNDLGYDPEYDQEVNKLLEEVEEELFVEDSAELKAEKDTTVKADTDQYEDFYDEFPPEEPIGEIPLWYSKILQKKQQDAMERLKSLSLLVGYASPKAWEHMKRIEQDHHTPFCKINPPRHPPLNKPWQNYWRFKTALKCNVDPPEPNHAHTADCEEILLEHFPTLVSTKTRNIVRTEFPDHVMRTVELFQNFINATSKTNPYLDSDEVPDSVYERPSWVDIRIRVNYKNEILLVATGKGVSPLLKPLKQLFLYGVGRTCNVTSLYCLNIRRSPKKQSRSDPPSHLYGALNLRDKVGPITIVYTATNKITFNSVEAVQLGRVMMEYLNPTAETTVIDIGCSIGVLSLMLATKADTVIGLSAVDSDIKIAEEIKIHNKLHNASFINCTPKEVHTKCSSLVKRCISVAVLNLSTPFGKSPDVMKALRNLPSVWRVALYGTFTKEFQKHITILTSSDHHMGDEFLPMQACLVEKSPTTPQDFHIVVVFERKSLIEPSLDLIGFGPTVNIKEDSDSKNMKPLRIPDVKTSEIVGKGYGKFRQYDSPALPKGSKDEDVKPVVVPPLSKDDEPTNLLPPDYGKPVKKPPPLDIAKLYDQAPNPTINRQLKKIYDSPLLPKSNNSASAEPKKSDSSSTDIIKLYDTTPNPAITRHLKKIYDSPLLPKSNDSASAESKKSDSSSLPKSVKAEPNIPTTSNDPRSDFASKWQPSSPAPTDPRRKFPSESNSSLPLSTDPRCDFLAEAITFNPNQEPFDQKKIVLPKKERNHFGSTKSKKDNRFDCPIKREKQNFPYSSSSQDSSSRSPPPIKREPRIEARTQPIPSGRAFNIPPTFKTEAVDSTTFLLKKETRFDSPPLFGRLPPQYGARPPDYFTPPANFCIPPPMVFNPPLPGYMVPGPDFSVPPPLPKQESPRSPVKKEERELSPDSTFNKLPKQNSDASSKPDDVLLDAIIKSEPMDLDEDCNEENLPREQPLGTVRRNALVKSEDVTTKQEPTQTFPAVRIKSEPIDPSELSDHVNEPPTSTELPDSTELPVRIKTEPIDRDEPVTTTMMPPPTFIKQESLSPTVDREAFMNMPTPVHRPAALAERDRDSVSSPPASANFKTIDGFEFSVQPNQSYLIGMASTTVKKEPGVEEGDLENQDRTLRSKPSQPEPVVRVKREESPEKLDERPPLIRVKKLDTVFDNISNHDDDEISIVAEKKLKKIKKEKSKSKDKYDSKYKKEYKKKKYKGLDLDMRQLIVEKKKIKKILKRQRSSYDRSLSPSPDRRSRYRSPSTNWDRGGRSPPAAYRRANRSPSTRFEKWVKQAPSPSGKYSSRTSSPGGKYSSRTSSSGGKYPSRPSSPRDRWSIRSPVSPNPSRRCRRSPSSSTERQLRRSPSLPRSRKFKRSLVSPSERRCKRSPLSPSNRRFTRSSISPPGTRSYRRSSPSPSVRRFKHTPMSPNERRFRHSPSSPNERRSRRSPSSPSDRRFSRSSISPSGDRNYRRTSISPNPRTFQRSPSQYEWTRSSPLSFGQINSMLEQGVRSPSVPRFTQSAMGNYADLCKTTLSPVFESNKRKSSLPPEATENFEAKKAKSGEIGDQWDIPGKADLSPLTESPASSPDKRMRTKKKTLPPDSVSSTSCTTTTAPTEQVESTS